MYSEMGTRHQSKYLLFGLAWLKRLITAPSYDERYLMLTSKFYIDERSLIPCIGDFNYDIDQRVGDLTEAEKASLKRPTDAMDLDKGPAGAWFWAYQDENLNSPYNENNQSQLRDYGYVMFDYERLCHWGMFNQPFIPPKFEYDYEGHELRYKEMKRSWDQRSKIWQSGGRGWWSEGDESKIIWLSSDEYAAYHASQKKRLGGDKALLNYY